MIKNYKLFDADFWKYHIFVEYAERFYLFPGFSIELEKFDQEAYTITFNFWIWRYFVAISYCELDAPNYEILFNDFDGND